MFKRMHFMVIVGIFMLLMTQLAAAYTIEHAGSQPFVRWVVYRGTPEDIEKAAAIRSAYTVRCLADSEGIYAMYGGIDSEVPEVYRSLEIYENQESFEQYCQSAQYTDYVQEIKPLIQQEIVLDAEAFLLESKPEGQAQMVRMARLVIDPQRLDEYKAVLHREILDSVANEPGVIALLATTEVAHPNIFHLLEIYENEDAYAKHIAGPYFQKYNETAQQLVQEKDLIVNKPQHVAVAHNTVKK